MRRFPAILALLAVAAAGSGAIRYAHEHAVHAHAPAAAAAAHDAGHGHGHRPHDHPVPAPHHDESRCLTHALLKLPMLGAGQTPVLVLVGVFVALVALPVAPARCRRPALDLDCRGPPVLA